MNVLMKPTVAQTTVNARTRKTRTTALVCLGIPATPRRSVKTFWSVIRLTTVIQMQLVPILSGLINVLAMLD